MRKVRKPRPFVFLSSKVMALLLVLVLAGLLAGGYASYSAWLDRQRPGGQVVMVCDPELEAIARRLAELCEDQTETRVEVRHVSPSLATNLLETAEADIGLYYEGSLPDNLAYERLFWDHKVAVSPVFGPCEELSLEEAETLPERDFADVFDKQCFTMRWGDLAAGVRLLPIDGQMPSPEILKDGTYPLCKPAGFYTCEGFDFLWVLKRPNIKDVRDLRHLAASEDGQEIYYTGMKRHTNIRITGDIMLARGVGLRIEEHGWDYPLAKVADFLSKADLAVANLESPMGEKGAPIPGKMIWFRARPETAQALVQAGIDAVNLANNHILDYDTENFLETMDILDRVQVKYFGGGKDIHEARTPLLLEAGGLRIAFLGYSEFAHPDLFWSFQYPRTFEAKEGVPGVPPINRDYIAEDIAQAHEKADVVVVMFHWGEEDTHIPKPFWIDQKEIGHYAVDAGADLVIGTHPHAVQGIELYKGKYIAYSLGNFVMDQRREFQKESIVLTFTITEKGVSALTIDPCYIEDCQPAILQGPERAAFLERLREYSEALR